MVYNFVKSFLIDTFLLPSPFAVDMIIIKSTSSFIWFIVLRHVLIYICFEKVHDCVFNPIQDGEEGRLCFSSVTSTNVGISPKNFLTFSFNPFARLVYHFKAVRSASPKSLNLIQEYPSKKWFFSGQILIKLRL